VRFICAARASSTIVDDELARGFDVAQRVLLAIRAGAAERRREARVGGSSVMAMK